MPFMAEVRIESLFADSKILAVPAKEASQSQDSGWRAEDVSPLLLVKK